MTHIKTLFKRLLIFIELHAARIFLQLVYVIFLGYHGYEALVNFMDVTHNEALFIISVIEVSVVCIDWTGISFWGTKWFIKLGLLCCSVFFSLYGFNAQYKDQENLILELSSNTFQTTNEFKINNIDIELVGLSEKQKQLERKIVRYIKIGDAVAGHYKHTPKLIGLPYTGFDVVGWTEDALNKVLKDVKVKKTEINSLKIEDQNSVAKKGKNKISVNIAENNLELMKWKFRALSFLIIFIAFTNMVVSSAGITRNTSVVTVELPPYDAKGSQRYPRTKILPGTRRYLLSNNQQIDKLKPTKNDRMFLAFSLILGLLRNRNKASPE